MKIEIHGLSKRSLLTSPIEILIVRSPDVQDSEPFKEFVASNISMIKGEIQIFGDNAEAIHDELDEYIYQKSLLN